MNIKFLLIVGVMALSLVSVKTLLAADANATATSKDTAVEVAGKANDGANSGGMSAVPAEIKASMAAFDASRKKFLTEQKALLGSLKGAHEAGRAKIREKLESNRAAFLADLETYRATLKKNPPNQLKRPEIIHVVTATHDATPDPASAKGQR
jgi:hypothetical protein